MRIGIDVGGTNTDAVLMEGQKVIAEVKTPTTPDVTSGVVTVLRNLVDARRLKPGQIQAVMIGTTHFTNAVVEAKRLMPTAVVRLGLPATQALPPMVDWPDRLRKVLGGHVYLCHGGHEFDGRQQPVQRSVSRSAVQPCRRVLRAGRVQAVKVDEDLLGHVLGLVPVGQHTVRDPRHPSVFGCEEGFERLFVRTNSCHGSHSEVHTHYQTSTAGGRFVTGSGWLFSSPDEMQARLAQEGPAPDSDRQPGAEDHHRVDAPAPRPRPVDVLAGEPQGALLDVQRPASSDSDRDEPG